MEFQDSDFLKSNPEAGTLWAHEMEVFRQHQILSFTKYKEKRLKFLASLAEGKQAMSIVNHLKPSIAVFAGSFNPFHKGHYNVLQKAENIFDKVIIAFGQNPEKSTHGYKIPQTIRNRQIEQYEGLLTDFILSLGHDVIVIRGLRNSTDFQYEQNQYRYIQELMPDIRIVNIFCDKEFEHISSSGIRTLEKYGRHRNYLLD
jgi:pantetheine-phosphate adenylyltransferase